MSENQLSNLRNGMLHAALEVQMYSANPTNLIERLRHIGENLNPYLNTGFAIKVLIYLLRTTEVTLKDFKQNLPEPIINKVMSTYDRIVAEGMEKGLEQGFEQGLEKGRFEERRKIILNSFDNGIDIKTIQIITGETVENITKILKLHKRIS